MDDNLKETPAAIADPAPPAPAKAADSIEDIPRKVLEAQVVACMRSVYDPEIPVNIYELGMVYGIELDPPAKVTVKMTLTSPSCPVAGSLPGEVQTKLAGLPGITEAKVELVWDPPWDPSRMSEAAKLELGML